MRPRPMTVRPVVLAAIQATIQDDTDDAALLDGDSLGRVCLILELEERLDVDVADEIGFGWRTVGEVVAWAEGLARS